jgi:hypothetical protein
MELIVKIGADQQGLQQTIERLKSQFKNMNTSMPGSWGGQQQAQSRYGNIFNSTAGNSNFDKFKEDLNKLSPAVGGVVEKLSGLIGPIAGVSAVLGVMGAAVHGLVSSMQQANSDIRTGRVTGMSGLMSRRWRQAATAAGIDEGSAATMVSKLNTQVGAFNAGDSGAQKLFGELGINPSNMSVDDLLVSVKGKRGGMKDPAARARLSKGLFGKGAFESTELLAKLETPGLADTEGIDMTKASAMAMKWKKLKRGVSDAAEMIITKAAAAVYDLTGGEKLSTLSSGIAGAEDAVSIEAKAAKPAGRSKLETVYRWRDGSVHNTREPKDKMTGGQSSNPGMFENDSLSRAGLFTGSSLLFNPNFTVFRDQLEVLRKIEAHTARARSPFS